jgi:hypothetical protein
MKTTIISLFSSIVLAVSAFAHGDIDLGPNGGRLVEFRGHGSLHAEFVLKNDSFIVSLYDEKSKKEIPVTGQALTITHKESGKELSAELKDGKWILTKPAGDDFWLILQLKENDTEKAKVGRLHYDGANCSGCNKAEWLCQCSKEGEKK